MERTTVRDVTLGAVLLLLVLAPTPVRARQMDADGPSVPHDLAQWAVDFHNDAATARFPGGADVPEGRVVVGDVVVLEGDVSVGGEIDGDLLVINGDLVFREGGRVGGEVTVLGGEVSGASLTSVEGGLVVYEATLPYVSDGNEIALRVTPAASRERRFAEREGRAEFALRSGVGYNRVEGLPLVFGPEIRTAGTAPLRAEFFAIWRTETGLQDEFGYDLSVEQFFGGSEAFSVGAEAISQVQPIERWGLTDTENSLTTVVFHRDYRDYYERRGWAAFATARLPGTPLRLRVEYRDESHRYAPVEGPWSLYDDREPWRAQPLIAEGDLQSVEGSLTLDSRAGFDGSGETSGWWAQLRVRRGLSGGLSLPAHASGGVPPEDTNAEEIPARAVSTDVGTAFLDVRRYARIGRRSELRVRGLLGGSLSATALPPQFQHALGGEGSLPGHSFFSGDCGARAHPVSVTTALENEVRTVPAFANYGCDRVALFQAEYRGYFGRHDDSRHDGSKGDHREPARERRSHSRWGPLGDAGWAAFFDAGRGWAYGDSGGDDPVRPSTDTLLDVGLGVLLGDDLGVYVAFPMNSGPPDRGAHFFVRLSHRF